MKQKLPLVVAAAFAAALGFNLIAQTGDPGRKALPETRVEITEFWKSSPNTESPEWRLLAQDVGLMLRQDRAGIAKARLYVRTGEDWTPVAVDGFSEIAPDDLFLRH